MKRLHKQFLSLLLCTAMVLTMIPGAAAYAEAGTDTKTSENISDSVATPSDAQVIELEAPEISLATDEENGGLSYRITPAEEDMAYIAGYLIQVYDADGAETIGSPISVSEANGNIPLSGSIQGDTDYTAKASAVAAADSGRSDSLFGKLCPSSAAAPVPLPEPATPNSARAVILPQAAAFVETQYIDENGDTKTETATAIDSTTAMLTDGWYVVNSDVSLDHSITVSGDVCLILADGCALTGSNWDVRVNVATGNCLTVFGQDNGSGKLSVPGGIGGGSGGVCGTITINGGIVTASGSDNSAGIGDGSGGNGGTITINGGTVTASGSGSDGAGIGGGTVTINGGTVTASSSGGAGIGGGFAGNGGTITINGGTVTASSSDSGAGIGGGGSGGSYGTITINGGMVTASGFFGAGIGGGTSASGGTINIQGGTVTATSSYGTGIGGGFAGSGGTITINGGTVQASSMNAAPVDANGNPLSLTTVELENVNVATQITSLILNTGSYGIGDMYTDSDGFLYLWLRAGTTVTGAETAGQRYAGAIASGQEDILHAAQPSISPAMKLFLQDTPRDAVVTKNDLGCPLAGIYNGSVPLVRGTDYTITGDTVTLKKEYLQTLPIGTATLTFDFGLSNKNPRLLVYVAPQNQAACLAIGDSIASGYGLPGYTPSLPQTLPDDAYMAVVGKALNLSSEGITLDGMTSDDLCKALTDSGPERDMLMEYLSYAKVVTISIGSNDILQPLLESTASLLPDCQDVQGIPAALAELRNDPGSWSTVLGHLPDSLKRYLSAIYAVDNFKGNFAEIIVAVRAAAPEAKIYVTNLYNPYKGMILSDVNGQNPFDFGALAENHIQEMNQAFDPVSPDYTLIDVHGAFASAPASPVNADPAAMNFDPHPNKTGHGLIAQLILSDCGGSQTAPAVSPNSLTVVRGGMGTLTVDLGKGASAATEADLTVTDGKIASVSTSKVTASTAVTVTGCEVGSTNITVTFHDRANTVKAVTVTVLPELTWPAGSTLTASRITNTAATLNWFPVLGGSGIASGYKVYQNGQVIATVEGGTNVSYTVNGLSSSTSYRFQVQAGTSGGWWTTDGPSATVTTAAEPSHSSSGGGSGSGSSNIIALPEKRPDYPVMAGFEITPAVDENGYAAAVLSETDIFGAIKKAQADAAAQGKEADGIGIAARVKLPDTAKSLGVTMSRSALQDLANAGVKELQLDCGLLSIKLDHDALKEILSQSTGDVILTVKPVQTLSKEAEAFIGTRPVYSITVSYVKDSKTVNINSLGGGTATLSISCTPGKNEAVGYLFGVYVDAKGKAARIPGSAYDANSGGLMLATNHFSIYGVGYTAPSAKFTDITGHWARESIDYVVGRGLLSGTSETTFAPDTAMTRGMLVTALCRLSEADTKAYTANSFTDVKADSAFAPYIEWAYRKGIVQGIGSGQFAPDRAVTREEIAVIFANYAKAAGYTLPVTRVAVKFADDGSIGSTYRDAVKAMQQAGIMMGENNNIFNPGSGATRGSAAAMLARYIKLTIDPATAQGWAKNDSGQWMYFKDGKALTGWQTVNGKVYCFDSSGGAFANGWKQDAKGQWFFLSSDGSAVTGWKDIGSNGSGKRYYFDSSSVMVSGKWLEIGGKWYYFYADGSLAKGTKVDGYEVDGKGVRKTK